MARFGRWLLASIFLAGLAQAQTWEWVSPLPAGASVADLFFLNTAEGWIGAQNGLILHTTDGGNTWDSLSTLPGNRLVKLDFLNTQLGWAASTTTVHSTSDGGQSWISCSWPVYEDPITAMVFLDASVCLASSSYEDWESRWRWTCYHRTTDGGASWSWTGPYFTFLDFVADYIRIDARHVWEFYQYGKIPRYSADAGSTWTQPYPFLDAFSMAAPDTLTWWFAHMDQQIRSTTNGGATWTLHPEVSGEIVAFASRDLGCVLGYDQAHITTDGGQSWVHEARPSLWGSAVMLEDGAVWVFSVWESPGSQICRRRPPEPPAPLSGVTIQATDTAVVLQWPAGSAPFYRIYSSATVDGPFDTLEGTTDQTTFTVPLGEASPRFFIVRQWDGVAP